MRIDQAEDHLSFSLAPATTAWMPTLQANATGETLSPCGDPASVPLPPSPPASPPATISITVTAPHTHTPAPEADPTVGPGELGGSARASPKSKMLESPQVEAVGPTAAFAMSASHPVPGDAPDVSFEEFATRYRQSQCKRIQRRRIEKRLRATKISIGLSARLIRIGNTVQRGLVEALKRDDKASFVALYHMLFDLQESSVRSTRPDEHEDGPDEREPSAESGMDRSSDFFHQLSPQSRTDLLEILRLVRSDPQFLVDRLRSFTSAQLAALTSQAAALDSGDSAFPSASTSFSSSRLRGQYSLNRISVQSASFQNHAFAFERTDPLSILLCNVFAAPLEPDSSEAWLRLDVWSTVCAQLISSGSSKFYTLIGQILSSWATGCSWKARPQFELYLMDILQTGAFLLEQIDSPAELNFTPDALDPLRTDVAEEFFTSAVDKLFRVLDDLDGGFPHAVLQFAKAVLRKLDSSDSRSRFLEYLFVQWFFPKFLYSALTYPESHGLLLDFHIRKDAREKLLGQVGLRAYSQVFAVLRSMHHFSVLRPSIKVHVDNMLSRFQNTTPSEPAIIEPFTPAGPISHRDCTPDSLLLSSTDILTLLDALFPQVCSPAHSSPASAGGPSWASSVFPSHNLRPEAPMEPGFFRPNPETSPRPSSQSGSIFSVDSLRACSSSADELLAQTAARIRFELSDFDEPNGRARLDHPGEEHWTVFSVARDGHAVAWTLLADRSAIDSDDEPHSTSLGLEENHEALQTAIIRLVKESHVHQPGESSIRPSRNSQPASMTLKQLFNQAMITSQNNSDFVGAHYWWNATRQLRQGANSAPSTDDTKILGPMHRSCIRSLKRSTAVIERCENDFLSLDHSLRQLQAQVKALMMTLSKIRNKMWYMTDVKNSMRYEEARHVAMALTMIYSARPYNTEIPDESRYRSGARALGGSLFQKPELQVMNMMKAPSSQGGPRKLSDEQVELTRKWLAHSGIENFCKGEERIHRFCYEVWTSVNRLVGETMAETPVLWASELFQRERAKYEGHGSRAFPGLSIPTTPRPSTNASDDPLHVSELHSLHLPVHDPIFRPPHDAPSSLGRKPSIQSLVSDKYRTTRDLPSIDVSSIGGSPGRAASTSTGDTYSSFWSAPQRHPMYASSVSTVYSRPPSMFSEGVSRQPRRTEHKTHGKTEFMSELRRTLTSLLLSDLGSPVWSCGSETDAWFSSYLDQPHIRTQIQKHAAVRRFYSDYEKRSKHSHDQHQSPGLRRSRSLDGPGKRTPSDPSFDTQTTGQGTFDEEHQSTFSYKAVFHRLIEVFSRHGNPFVKLNALRDLRSLVVASLISPIEECPSVIAASALSGSDRGRTNIPRSRATRKSFSAAYAPAMTRTGVAIPVVTPPESVTCDSRRSDFSTPTEDQIVTALRDLILEVKPKTLFRDLQFISAFVPGEQLNQSDHGTAFLQFGLAALSLKDEVCNSMVEMADRIVSQELMRRHPLPGPDCHSRPGHAIEDAAAMWIITAKEGNPVAQRELAILYLTHPERLQRVTLPLSRPRDTFKAEMMYRRGKDSKSDPQSMCLALHWMQLSANGGDVLARNRLREREEFDSIA